MTLISGHQRKRAALEAGVTEVPVIIDGSTDDSEVLMKLIETNFGRIKNDPIKQAKWIKEYEELRGVQGSSGRPKKLPDNLVISQSDIAKELGVSVETMRSLKSLLKLDPAIQQLISDGNITPTVGFKLIAKLSPEDQRKLIDKLPDDVKLSAKSIEAKINEIRAEGAANANAVQQENDELRGRNDSLVRENNELRSGKIDISEATQNRINSLEEEKRGYYEKWNDMRNENERLRKEMDKAIQAMKLAESKANGGDEAAIALENRIAELEIKIQSTEREKNDLEFQLSEKDEEIEELKSRKKDGALRSAVTQELSNSEYNERQLTSFKTKVSQSASSFEMACNEILKDINLVGDVEMDTRKALREIIDRAMVAAKNLGLAIMPDSLMVTYNMTNGNTDDYDDDYFSEDDLICSGESA
jgi:ParB-like chromosome segregation protein Spo0J